MKVLSDHQATVSKRCQAIPKSSYITELEYGDQKSFTRARISVRSLIPINWVSVKSTVHACVCVVIIV